MSRKLEGNYRGLREDNFLTRFRSRDKYVKRELSFINKEIINFTNKFYDFY